MSELSERQRNQKRFNNLSADDQEMLNRLAVLEFRRPLEKRRKAVVLLDRIEFKST